MKIALNRILLTILPLIFGMRTNRICHTQTPLRSQESTDRLLQHATKLTHHGLSSDQYFWISDHEVLIIRGEDTYEIIRKDIWSGRERKLAKLSALFNVNKMVGISSNIGVDMSPDHRWFLWHDPNAGTAYAARLDGSGYFQCNGGSSKYDPAVWSPNGKAIGSVAITRPYNGLWVDVCNVKPPHAEQQWKIYPPNALFDSRKYWTGHADQDVYLSFVGFVTGDRLLLSKDLKTDKPKQQITLYSLQMWKPKSSRSLPDHKYVIRLPRKVKYPEIHLSPDRKRLAWLADYTVGRQRKAAIWICRPNGSGMREIGTLTNRAGDDDNKASDLEWMPDGRHVSLFYNQAVWVIPVGREK